MNPEDYGLPRKLAWHPLTPFYKRAICTHTGDISKWSRDGTRDAIVCPVNEDMLGGGQAYEAIHNAAGPQLRDACFALRQVQRGIRCPLGEAKITRGYDLPAAYVIHTVGPEYGSYANPEESLRSVYRSCLSLAKENRIQYVAFPAISCGTSGYPVDVAATVALSTVKEFANDFKIVYFVIPTDGIYRVWCDKAHEMFYCE